MAARSPWIWLSAFASATADFEQCDQERQAGEQGDEARR